jgi:hypothetical protein
VVLNSGPRTCGAGSVPLEPCPCAKTNCPEHSERFPACQQNEDGIQTVVNSLLMSAGMDMSISTMEGNEAEDIICDPGRAPGTQIC